MELLIEALPTEQNPLGPIEYVDLTWDQRRRPRRTIVTTRGTEVALALKRGTVLKEGAVLCNSVDRTIIVRAKPEAVLRIRPASVAETCRVAHHLGNWHRCLEATEDDVILTEEDAPLTDWLNREGIAFSRESLPYHPNLAGSDHD